MTGSAIEPPALRDESTYPLGASWAAPAVLVVIAAQLVINAPAGWFPWDDGTMAQLASRVLGGEVPHIDFDEPYSGLLDYWYSLAFRAFGESMIVLRWQLVVVALAGFWSMFQVARPVSHPLFAALLVLASSTFSVAQYSAPLPSWYNLFPALFAVYCATRFQYSSEARWLFAAGLLCGLSVLSKITGLYIVAAFTLGLLHWELERLPVMADSGRDHRFLPLKCFIVACFILAFIWLIVHTATPFEWLHYGIPILAIGCFLIYAEFRRGHGTLGFRLRALSRLWVPFGIGVALPPATAVLIYLSKGGLDQLIEGVLITPQTRFFTDTTHGAVDDWRYLFLAIPFVWACVGGPRSRWVRAVLLFAVFTGAVAAVAFGNTNGGYVAVWAWLRMLPAAALFASLILAVENRFTSRSRLELAVLLSFLAVFWSVVQYPFPHGIYFFYVAPLALLALAVVCWEAAGVARLTFIVTSLTVILFAQLHVGASDYFSMGIAYHERKPEFDLGIGRAGLRAPQSHARQYQTLLAVIEEKARGRYIYAGPDCPEVYFLSGKDNPTRTFFEMFDDDYGQPLSRVQRFDALLDRHDINLVAINEKPAFSGQEPPEVRQLFRERYPNWIQLGNFRVGWRETSATAGISNRP